MAGLALLTEFGEDLGVEVVLCVEEALQVEGVGHCAGLHDAWYG